MAFEKMDGNIFVERTKYCFSWGKKIIILKEQNVSYEGICLLKISNLPVRCDMPSLSMMDAVCQALQISVYTLASFTCEQLCCRKEKI